MTKATVMNIIETLPQTKLFSGVSTEDIKTIAGEYSSVKSFKKGETVFEKNTDKKCVGVIIKGSAVVKKEHITINHLVKNDLFGAVTLYNKNEHFVNSIIAESDCKIVFVNKEGVDYLISKSPKFAKHYIEYLSQRIYFLNSKIENYTMPGADEKLYAYLVKKSVGGKVLLTSKMTELAKLLNLSRASLYRAFDELVENNKIVKDDKNITIL